MHLQFTYPDMTEVIGAVNSFKSNKTHENENIVPVMLKADSQASVNILLPLIQSFGTRMNLTRSKHPQTW